MPATTIYKERMSISTLEISQKPGTENEPMIGANIIVKLNGQTLDGVTSLKIEINASGLANGI